MEYVHDGENSLQHWGIKGQKWGVRRFQNPDGSYTEEGIKRYQKKYPYQNPDGSLNEKGKKDYMKAARKGKLDYKHLSDKDLDMINQRFGKESLYKKNVENYEKSTFKYKAKEAVIARIKGSGGGKGKGGGGKGVAGLLAMPIKKAFEDALKFDASKGGGDNGGGDSELDRASREAYHNYKRSKNGKRFCNNYKLSEDDKHNAKLAAKGKRFMDYASYDWSSVEDDKGRDVFRSGSTEQKRTTRSRTAEEIALERRRAAHPKKPQKPADTRSNVHKQLDRERKLEERAASSGIIIARHRDDDPNALYHGQIWYVKRKH